MSSSYVDYYDFPLGEAIKVIDEAVDLVVEASALVP